MSCSSLILRPASCHRYDVLLTANKAPGNYWISVTPQYRLGTPSGYGVLHDAGADAALPTTPTPQGTVAPWALEQVGSTLFYFCGDLA